MTTLAEAIAQAVRDRADMFATAVASGTTELVSDGSEVIALRAQLKTAEVERDEARAQAAEASDARVGRLRETLRREREELRKVRSERNDVRNQLAAVQAGANRAFRERDTTTTELKECRAECERLQEEVKGLKEYLGTEAIRVNRDMKELTQKLDEALLSKRWLTDELAESRAKITQLQTELFQVKAENQ